MLNYGQYVEKIKQSISEVSPQWLDERGLDTLVIIDIRDESELSEGQVPSAVHISRGMLEAKIMSTEQLKSQVESGARAEEVEILLYCQSGARSAMSAKSLADMGMKNVKSLRGGYKGWKEGNFPTA